MGVLPTRLSAVDEAATLDVFCSDKTGTLTRNELAVTAIRSEPGFDEARVLGIAALASSEGGQDPVDAAIRSAAAKKGSANPPKSDQVRPIRSRYENVRGNCGGCERWHSTSREGGVCGDYQTDRIVASGSRGGAGAEEKGFRVLAVAVGPPATMRLAGIIALSDPPREDAAELIKELSTLAYAWSR